MTYSSSGFSNNTLRNFANRSPIPATTGRVPNGNDLMKTFDVKKDIKDQDFFLKYNTFETKDYESEFLFEHYSEMLEAYKKEYGTEAVEYLRRDRNMLEMNMSLTSYLRTGDYGNDKEGLASYITAIKRIDKMYTMVSGTKSALTLYRGESYAKGNSSIVDAKPDDLVGAVITDKGYRCFTTVPAVALDYATESDVDSVKVIWVVNAPKGSKLIPWDYGGYRNSGTGGIGCNAQLNPNRGSGFKITKVLENKQGQRVIYADLIEKKDWVNIDENKQTSKKVSRKK